MADNGNLIPLNKQDPETKRAIQSKGGKECSRRKRERRAMKELLQLAFERQIENKNTGETKSAKEVTAIKLVDGCVRGDLKAISLAMELLGEKNRTVEVTGKDGKDIFEKLSDAELLAQYEDLKRKLD